jgi:hypothetical protein
MLTCPRCQQRREWNNEKQMKTYLGQSDSALTAKEWIGIGKERFNLFLDGSNPFLRHLLLLDVPLGPEKGKHEVTWDNQFSF